MCGLRLLRSYICFIVHSDFVKIKVNPQRVKGIHRAARCIAAKVTSCPSGRFSRRFAPQNDIKCFARKNTLPKKSEF